MPFNLKKLTERRVELMTQLENMVKKLTGVLNEMRADGTIQSIAEKYGVDVSMAVWGN